ncbi:hypothetical protein FIU95_13695 [Microbulbifer sp. THAF38]|nr:hypothetical protein FIU95_13695 [Microbulbifer sp. THAF38]
MDIRTIRRENARRIAREMGGVAALARALETPNSGVSQVIGKNPRRNIGDSMARRIESAGGYHYGWLDAYHGNEQAKTPHTPGEVSVYPFAMEAGEIRLKNARRLSEEFASLKGFSEALGITQSQLSQLIGPNPRRLIGTTMARRIETVCKKDKGWLDVIHAHKARIEPDITTIKEIRARNVRFLRSKHGPKNRDFADALGISESYASQISHNPPITNLGDKKAREIETRLNLELGWFDHAHPEKAKPRKQLKPGQIDELLVASCVSAMMEVIEEEGMEMPAPRIFSAALVALYSASQPAESVIDPLPILRSAILAGTVES